MLVVSPLNTYSEFLDRTITAEEAAVSLQKIFDEYGNGKYKVAEYDKNKKLDKKEVKKFLEDMKKNLIEQNVKSKELGTTEYEDEFVKPTAYTETSSRIIHNTTFYESESCTVDIGIFGAGRVNVTWLFNATYRDPDSNCVLPYFTSCTNPYDINSSYSGLGQVVYNNISYSCTILSDYITNPLNGARCATSCYTRVSGEIQILITSIIEFTYTEYYCAEAVERGF